MPKLPDNGPPALPDETRLQMVCDRAFQGTEPTTFFTAVATLLGVEDNIKFRLLLANACCPPDGWRASSGEAKNARRLVRLMRQQARKMAAIVQPHIARFEPYEIPFGSSERSHCEQHYRQFVTYYHELEPLVQSGVWNLRHAAVAAFDAVWALRAPWHRCQATEAVRALDRALDNWTDAVGGIQGKRDDERPFDQLIRSLAHFFDRVTGRPASAGRQFKELVILVGEQQCEQELNARTKVRAHLLRRLQEVRDEEKDVLADLLTLDDAGPPASIGPVINSQVDLDTLRRKISRVLKRAQHADTSRLICLRND